MKPVALTIGDPSGIGPELTLKAWHVLRNECPFFLIGDMTLMAEIARAQAVPLKQISTPDEAALAMPDALPVLHQPFAAPVIAGRPDPDNATGIISAIDTAVHLARSGQAAAVCTNPINKAALRDGAGFAFPGHTEYLAHLCGADHPVMLLAGPELRVVPVTIHIPLHQVPQTLTSELLEKTIMVTHQGLIDNFGLENPRIAIAGLNPHAGEDGHMGHEEGQMITPLIDRLRARGMIISGPHPADTLFHARARKSYDVAICMYHDQALVPVKTLDFDHSVNTTLGLDFIRTSPDHGTAYDIAGQGIASESSLVAALSMARDMARARG